VRLEWTRAASRDLDSVDQHISRDNSRAALETVHEIIRLVGMLTEHPGVGRPGRVEGTREMVIAGLPYVVAYLNHGDTVTVLRVLHGAMKWPQRF
jgi:toxin ParE1/3/4